MSTVLVDDHLSPVDEVREFYAGEVYVAAGDTVRWLPLQDLFALPRCAHRFGRRRFLIAGPRVHQCDGAVVGAEFCLLHGGGFEYDRWLTFRDDLPYWIGPLSAGMSWITVSHNVFESFTAKQSAVMLFRGRRYPGQNAYDPSLLIEQAVAPTRDEAWRLALGALALHH